MQNSVPSDQSKSYLFDGTLVFLYRILLMKLQFKSVKEIAIQECEGIELSGRTKFWHRSRTV